MADWTKTDLAASLLYALQNAYGHSSVTAPLEVEGFTWSFDGRDLELVIDDAGDAALDATIWDNTEADPVQVVTVRLTLQVIA